MHFCPSQWLPRKKPLFPWVREWGLVLETQGQKLSLRQPLTQEAIISINNSAICTELWGKLTRVPEASGPPPDASSYKKIHKGSYAFIQTMTGKRRHASRLIKLDWREQEGRGRQRSEKHYKCRSFYSMLTTWIWTIHLTPVSISLKHEGLYFPSSYITVGREETNFKYNTITGKRQNFFRNCKTLYCICRLHVIFLCPSYACMRALTQRPHFKINTKPRETKLT